MSADTGQKIVVVRKRSVVAGGHHAASRNVPHADCVVAMVASSAVMRRCRVSVSPAVTEHFPRLALHAESAVFARSERDAFDPAARAGIAMEAAS